jgi:hypothetical protein
VSKYEIIIDLLLTFKKNLYKKNYIYVI